MAESQVRDYLAREKGEHLEVLQGFVRAASANPPGDTRDAVAFLEGYLTKHGIAYNVYAPQEDKPNIVATFKGEAGGTGPHLVLNGHIDVFPTGDPKEWKHHPLSGHNDGQFIHGRGTVDMKSGTAAQMIAFAYLYKHRSSLKGRVTLTMVSDEETGGKWGAKWLIENKPEECKGDILLNGEPGGLGSIRWGEKGSLRLTFEIKTRGALGTYLNLSEGANRIGVRLCTALLDIEKMPSNLPRDLRRYLERDDIRRAIDEVMGAGASDLTMRPTVNIGIWQGGLKVNMIPSSAEIQVDIRLPPGTQKEQVLEKINKEILIHFPEVTMQVQEAASNPSNLSSRDHPIVTCIAKHVKAETGVEPARIPGLGGTDAKHWRYAGVEAYTYGLSPMTMASTNERVSIHEFQTLIKIYALSIFDYLSS